MSWFVVVDCVVWLAVAATLVGCLHRDQSRSKQPSSGQGASQLSIRSAVAMPASGRVSWNEGISCSRHARPAYLGSSIGRVGQC